MADRRVGERRLLPHGGDRRTGDAWRTTDQLTRADCLKLIDATYEAWDRDRPFNRFLTALWARGGVDGRENAPATRQFLKFAGDFLRPYGEKLHYGWVQECGAVNREHVHILLHVPSMLDPLFRPKPLHWAKQCLPGAYVAGVIQSQPIAFGRDPETSPVAYEADLMAKLHYMLKCAPAEFETELGMDRWRCAYSKAWGKSGIVFGKRAGRWQERRK